MPVADDEQVKGGPNGYGSGVVLINHNETAVEDDANELDDLSVSNDAEVKGGPLKRIRIGGMSFGEEGVE